jgi:phosphoribosylanthranilate isomerase
MPRLKTGMQLRIKICGITNLDDALAAADAGADALGFMFYEGSPRRVPLQTAARISRALPPFLARVGVFVDAPEPLVHQAIAECGLDALQFHGAEPPEFCRRFNRACIKAFRVRDHDSLALLPPYDTSAWLLDSCVPGQSGGTGVKFNWDLARDAKRLGRPIILAGGLTPENIAEAIAYVRPFGVDVSSGVESAPGKKDPAKLRAFLQAARGAIE